MEIILLALLQTENPSDVQKSHPRTSDGFSKVVNVFLLLRFSYLGGQWMLKKLIVFLYQ